jgi:molybdopterin-guanine dinucleotide biosynthesis protein A
MRTAAVVLAGGRSSRMGSAKAALPWHGSTLLHHVCGLVARGVDGPVVVVRAAGQQLPQLPPGVEVLDDIRADLGPMEGIAVGLAVLKDRADIAFVCATDVPLLHPAFIRRLLRASATSHPACDIVLAHAGGYDQPLTAAYRTALAPMVAKFVAADRLRLADLVAQCTVVRLDEAALLSVAVPDGAQLRAADPDLDSLLNLNEPDAYAAAHARPAPLITVDGVDFHAATVATAAKAAGVPWDREVLTTVNGEQIGPDGNTPLVAGDVVAFWAANPPHTHAS